jgi:hypothetical protein
MDTHTHAHAHKESYRIRPMLAFSIGRNMPQIQITLIFIIIVKSQIIYFLLVLSAYGGKKRF